MRAVNHFDRFAGKIGLARVYGILLPWVEVVFRKEFGRRVDQTLPPRNSIGKS